MFKKISSSPKIVKNIEMKKKIHYLFSTDNKWEVVGQNVDRQNVDRHNVEQTKCRTDKMSNRQNFEQTKCRTDKMSTKKKKIL